MENFSDGVQIAIVITVGVVILAFFALMFYLVKNGGGYESPTERLLSNPIKPPMYTSRKVTTFNSPAGHNPVKNGDSAYCAKCLNDDKVDNELAVWPCAAIDDALEKASAKV